MASDQSQGEIPRNRIIDLTGLDRHQAWHVCTSYMVHPDDTDERERVAAYFAAKSAQKRGTLDQLSEETISRVSEAADKGVGSHLAKAAAGGGAAGQVLVAVVTMQENGVVDAGLDKAIHLVSEIYKGAVYHDGTPLRLGHNAVSKHWKKYGAVAPLWIGYLTLLANAKENGNVNDMAEWVDGSALAAHAVTWQEKAAQCLLPRQRRSLLPADAYWVKGVDGAEYQPSALTDLIRQALAKFTPRPR